MVWLPTIYTLQAQYLARYPVDLSNPTAIAILSIGISGYVMFRSVNHQKDIVRRTNGDCMIWGKKAEVIRAKYKTADGKDHESLLLCSGWSPPTCNSARLIAQTNSTSFRLVGTCPSCKLPRRPYPILQRLRCLRFWEYFAMDLRHLHDNFARSEVWKR